ncbi:MAG: 50S ribosomal protein L9 [Endomicrobiia bacterium]|nr:50S ribosomal protein L9 [Endomicrobiia bacterium]
MEVIFIKDVPGVASKGQKKKIAPGFARNYLFPMKMAIEITKKTAAAVAAHEKIINRRLTAERKKLEEVAKQIEALSVTLEAAVGEGGKMFGSVTAAEITENLAQQLSGLELPKHAVVLKEPIKQTGAHTVEVHLHPEVKTALKVWVIEKK